MTREEERELLTRAQRGDSAAFEEIVRANEAAVYHLALRRLGAGEGAERDRLTAERTRLAALEENEELRIRGEMRIESVNPCA